MWIESHGSLRAHPKLHKLKNELKIGQAQAIGHLHLLWWWCMDYAPDGNLSRYSEAEISHASGWGGDVTLYVTLLKRCGFLDTENDQICVHDWKRYRLHYDSMLERQEQKLFRTRERVRKWREKHEKRNASVTVQCNADVTPIPNQPKQPYITEFESFYKAYPKKQAKRKAIEAWNKHKPNLEVCLKAITQQKINGCLKEFKYAPMPASWLNGHRWNDEVIFQPKQKQYAE